MELTQKEINAFNQVQTAVTHLRDEYANVCSEIAAAEKLLEELPLLPVPVDDLKAAIIDMVEASGKDFRIAIKRQLIALATNHQCGWSVGSKYFALLDKPLRFTEINAALYGGASPAVVSYQNMLTGSNIGLVDTAIFSVAGDLVKNLLTSVMEELKAEGLGYGNLKPGQVGTNRAERRAKIQETMDILEALRVKKTVLSESLSQLGIVVSAR